MNFNYRLGYLGFPGSPSTPANLGFLDQRLAIEWVQKNVAAFGGDPEKIVLFGHSAGSASIDFYQYAWTPDPIVYGSAIMSGTVTSFGNHLVNTSEAGWYGVSTEAGCGNQTTASDEEILSCLRTKPVEQLFKISTAVNKKVISELSPQAQVYAGITGAFGPTIDNKTVFENYTTLRDEGRFIHTPILTGNNNDEGCLYAQRGTIPLSEAAPLTEGVFTCPTYYNAKEHAVHNLTTWKYRYFGVLLSRTLFEDQVTDKSYIASFPNVEAPICPGQPWHGQEVNVMFNSTQIATEFSATPREIGLGRYIRDVIGAFAHDPEGGLADLGWVSVNSDLTEINALGLNTTAYHDTISAQKFDADCLTMYTQGAMNY